MTRPSKNRFKVLLLVAAVSLLMVEYKLLKLQLIDHGFWTLEARKNRIRAQSLPFERGWILDRNMTPMAQTQNLYELRFVFRDFRIQSPAGHISMILLLLQGTREPVWDAARIPVKEVYANPESFLDRIFACSPEDILRGESRTLRTDLKDYLLWLFGFGTKENKAQFESLFESDAPRATPFGEVPFLSKARASILERVAAERRAIESLEDLLDLDRGELLAWPDLEARRTDEHVKDKLSSADSLEQAPTYKRYRSLHHEIDSRERTVRRDIHHEAAANVSVAEDLFPGFYITEKTRRSYPEGTKDTCPLLIGKTGLPNADELITWNSNRRRLEDLSLVEDKTEDELIDEENLRLMMREIDVRPDEEVGRMGLEAFLEPVLRGKRGHVIKDKAAGGRGAETIEFTPPLRGKDVVLTLDVHLQHRCEEVLSETKFPGSVVIMEVDSGAILAMATAPKPTREQLVRKWTDLDADPARPLFQRTVTNHNLPPPGSVFKLVTSVAALEEGICSPDETILCEKQIMVGNTDLNCEGLHGQIAMNEAIVKSCNIYFYRVGKLLEYDKLLDWAKHFGFGSPTGVLNRDLYGIQGRDSGYYAFPREVAGKLKESDPGTANLMRFAIGQGAIDDVTTMQVARMAAGIATGRLPQPHLISRIGIRKFEPPPSEDLGVSRRTLELVRQAMKEVVTRGTAKPDSTHNLDLTPFHVAGKTGTPQTTPPRPDHASFAGFWPFENPRYSFAVFVEDCDMHGGEIAAPVLNRILESEEARRYVENDP